MSHYKKTMKIKQTGLPASHVLYTDKYFLRTNEILKKEEINPVISMKVFCRGEGPVVGLEDAAEVLFKYSDLDQVGGEVWLFNKKKFVNNEPLMIIKGPAQSFVELETMYLGVLSSAISTAVGIEAPEPKQVTDKLKRLKDIYMDIPIIYFGARHYYWSLDKEIAAAALKGGASQTSTDIGSSNIGQKGVGTTPHVLTIILASIYGKENAALKTAELFDKHMPREIPRVTLVDTFNREITDSLAVAKYFGMRQNSMRVDTCGENIGESGSFYNHQKIPDPGYQTGTGVTIELVTNVRNALIENGYGDNTEIFLSSGFGNEAKARAFVKASHEYRDKTGYRLFNGVGIGEISPARFCTADVFEVAGKPLAKTGREIGAVDYSTMKRVI
ncbi:MAG: nicotinate phosphoribosyltransferase [Candidatus Aminicenantes bacterium]|nr:MAG: nicotinate phosphoribosyltransferase [Candidatus Aminicenantes bacterium]